MAGMEARPTARLPADAQGCAEAVRLLRAGGLVAFPTETVFGLGADGRNPGAVAALYAAKWRPRFNPLIAHIGSFAEAHREGSFDAAADALAQRFWPGPLTLVVPLAPTATVCDLARAGLASVALRMPSHRFARDLLDAAGFPIVAPSANRSGRVSPTAAAHVLADLDGRIDAVVEGSTTEIGLESTIVACLDGRARLLRPGGVPREDIEAVLGHGLGAEQGDPTRPMAPGALASHYAPRARVRLDAHLIRPGEAALLFGPDPVAGAETAGAVVNLSPTGSTREAAANLFASLRRLDATGAATIAVAPIPNEGLGEAINDRLGRAAAGR